MNLSLEINKCFAIRQMYKAITEKFSTYTIGWSTLNGIICRWMMREIGNRNTADDAILPSGRYVASLISEMKVHISMCLDDEDFLKHIWKVTDTLTDIKVGIISVNTITSNKVVFDTYSITRPKIILQIPHDRSVHLQKILTIPQIFVLMLRYHTLESMNNQLALPPYVYDSICQVQNINGELFASALNVNFKSTNFCSLFPDIERKCGSRGSFFKVTPPSGFYFVNPPFDNDIMNLAVKKLDTLCCSDKKYTFLGTIPVWDKEGVKLLTGKEIKYSDYPTLTSLKASIHLKELLTVPQSRAEFINYTTAKLITPCNIYVFILSNDDEFPLEQCRQVLHRLYGT